MPRRRNPVKTLFKVEELNHNSAIIIKAGSIMSTEKHLKELAQELVRRDLRDVLILTLASLDDFISISEEQMNRLGWYKKEISNASDAQTSE